MQDCKILNFKFQFRKSVNFFPLLFKNISLGAELLYLTIFNCYDFLSILFSKNVSDFVSVDNFVKRYEKNKNPF